MAPNKALTPASGIQHPAGSASIDLPFPLAGLPTAAFKSGSVSVAGGGSQDDAGEQARSPHFMLDLALVLAAIGDDEAAIDVLRRLLAVRPDWHIAWHHLAGMLSRIGDVAGARAAKAEGLGGAAVAVEPRRVVKDPSAGKLDASERKLRDQIKGSPPGTGELLLRHRLLEAPADVVAMRVFADLAMQRGRYSQSERLLERALAIAPGYSAARHAYALVLFRSNKEARAIPHLERLLAHDPRNVGQRTLLAACFASIGDMARAVLLYEAIIRDAPGHAEIWLSYAQALKHLGRKPDSMQAFRRCIEIDPTAGSAWWSLANFDNDPASETDVAAMRAGLASKALSPERRFHFHYALGRALEKSQDYAESFAHYAEGARIWRGEITYDADQTSSRVERAKRVFTRGFFETHAGDGCQDPAPIFIVGMPRAGSTLIEQILASHSAVEGTHELPELGHIVHELSRFKGFGRGSVYPECLTTLDRSQLAVLGGRYVERTRVYRKTQRPFFIDKMPANWIDAGLIHLILPNARIIDARRDPMANCWGAFKKYFGTGQSFTYDLVELGRYYTDYVGFMSHLDDVLPGRIYRVAYESMVDDTDLEIRRLLEYCGLPFEEGCLRFWENRRTVATASSEQVRRPIFRDGLDEWRQYEPWLTPLRSALQRKDAARSNMV